MMHLEICSCYDYYSTLTLDYEGLYIYKLVATFELPSNNLQLALLCTALGTLELAHSSKPLTLSKLTAVVKARRISGADHLIMLEATSFRLEKLRLATWM
ncbi:MAG: hypothetical protein BYD32DRAFT_458459 [Podila humilis]|nr:MAG: hypothetical protein BYD32DRAFT_458459 [Podila humilis]